MLPMVKVGIGITATIVAVLFLGYFRLRRRRRRFPAHGWLGFVALAAAELLLFQRAEPVATYFTPIAWSAYILIADAATFAVTGRSRLNDAPLTLARMALLSIPLWLIFEAYNMRLHNWEYVGVPRGWVAAMLGYGWSFATITPAIFETSDLVQALLPPLPGEPWKISRTAENAVIVSGAACLIVPLAVPQAIAAKLSRTRVAGFSVVARSHQPAARAAVISSAISQRDFVGASTVLWRQASSAAGFGNFGIIGPLRNGAIHFQCSRT